MKHDKLTHQGWEFMANHFSERDDKYGPDELTVRAVLKPPMDEVGAVPAPTTFGEIVETIHIIPRILLMPQLTS